MGLEHIIIADLVVFYRGCVLGRVRGIYTVNVLCQQNGVSADLHRTQGSAGIRGKEGVAGAAAKDHDTALFQMADGLGTDVGLCNTVHLNGGLYTNGYATLLQTICQSQRIDDRSQHAHMVGAGALHTVAAVLEAAPDIAATHNDGNL